MGWLSKASGEAAFWLPQGGDGVAPLSTALSGERRGECFLFI